MINIELRPIEPDDVPPLQEYRNQLVDYCREYRLLSTAHQEQWYEEHCRQAYEKYPHNLLWAIWTKNIPETIGAGGLTNIDWRNGIAELSLYIAPGCQHKGIGRASLAEIHRWAFDTLRLACVFVWLHDWDERGQSFVKRAGYIQQGILRNARFRDGRHTPIILFDYTIQDWQRRKP